jgi:26S proteasome regulatory subunit N9
MHPILDALNGSQHEWLKKLLFTFNEGNIGKFEALAPLLPKEVVPSFLSNTNMTTD